ncbi:hypothetical protein GCM10009558_000450 [Virgisporangium aurantiacum]
MARWLRQWLNGRVAIRPTTRLSHAGYIEQFLIPHIGRLTLKEVTVPRLSEMFARIGRQTNRAGRPHTPSTLAHIRTTLRAALNAAVRDGLITDNPARHIELPVNPRPRPVVWTPARIAAWQATGVRPRIAVWRPATLSEFLDTVRDDRLFALWWLLALRGLRRGEAAALRWSDIDLDRGELDVHRARTTAGYAVFEGAPKTNASRRTVALDKHTVKVLRDHHRRQRTAGAGVWVGGGYVFTGPDGRPLHPDAITRRFARLVAATGLPPIRLHDLRHGAACLAHAAGADLKTIQQQLGHATIAITADIYTIALPATQRHSAKATAKLLRKAAGVRRATKSQPHQTRDG